MIGKKLVVLAGLALLWSLFCFVGCEEKKANPATQEVSQQEWTCEGCHTNQAELALLADYMVGGGEAGEG